MIYSEIHSKQSLNKSISHNKRIRKEKARSEWSYRLPFLFNNHFLLLSVCREYILLYIIIYCIQQFNKIRWLNWRLST